MIKNWEADAILYHAHGILCAMEGFADYLTMGDDYEDGASYYRAQAAEHENKLTDFVNSIIEDKEYETITTDKVIVWDSVSEDEVDPECAECRGECEECE